MKLPQMVSNVNKSKKYVVEFGGINKSSRFREGELGDSLNLSSDLLPYISQRGKREQMGEFESPTAIHAHNGIAVVDGTRFLYKAEGETEFREKIQVTEGTKQIAQLNNAIIIYPDKVYCDITNVDNVVTKPLEKTIKLVGRGYSYKWSYPDYVYFTTVYHNRIECKDITSEEKIDAGFEGPGIENYFAKEVYENFMVGDVISFDGGSGYWGISDDDAKIEKSNIIIKSIVRNDSANLTQIYFNNNTFFNELNAGPGGYVVFRGDCKFSKKSPTLDYVCESGGRVWGISKNTIKASSYNDIKNFDKFEGLSSDSYSINVSTPGEFTGCAAFSSHLVFFKENYIHRIYGSRPSNFNMVVSGAQGVQKGCYNSIRMLNERLFYKGVDGVYMYSGGMPVLISEGLGAETYTDAVAGVQGNKYYISMKNSKGEYELFSYDTIKGVFLKEDNTQLIDTTQHEGKMLYIDSDGKLMAVTGNQDTDGVEWSAELREFNEIVNEKKGYSRITLRIELDEKAYMNAELSMDNSKFELVKTVSRPGKNIVNINIPPNRCDSFRLRLSGKGGCRVMNMVREFITGSEVR